MRSARLPARHSAKPMEPIRHLAQEWHTDGGTKHEGQPPVGAYTG